MAIHTKGNVYIIDLSPFIHDVEIFNTKHYLRVDSFETMWLMIKLAIHNDISVLESSSYYQQSRTDEYEELLVELIDKFYAIYAAGHDIDYRYSDDKLISYQINEYGELVLSIKKVVAIVHEDLDDLLGEGDVT